MTDLWTRSDQGVLFGVCQGISDRFKLDVMLVRLVLVVLTLMGFAGVLLYLSMALGLPRVDEVGEAMESRLFGVCARFAKRFSLDVGLVRSAALISLIFTGGTVFFVYIVLYFILPTMEELT